MPNFLLTEKERALDTLLAAPQIKEPELKPTGSRERRIDDLIAPSPQPATLPVLPPEQAVFSQPPTTSVTKESRLDAMLAPPPKQPEAPMSQEPSDDPGRGFWKAMIQHPEEKLPVLGGVVQVGKFTGIISASRRVGNPDFDYGDIVERTNRFASSMGGLDPDFAPKGATPESIAAEAEMLEASDIKLIEDYLIEIDKSYTKLGQIGRIVSEMPAFMIEFMMTGGLDRLGKQTAISIGRKLMKDRARSLGGRAAIKTGKFMTGAAFRSAGMPQRAAVAMLRRQMPEGITYGPNGEITIQDSGESPWTSIVKGAADHYIEIISESAGEVAAPAMGKLLRNTPFLGKALTQMEAKWLALPANRLKTAVDFTKKIGSKTGFNGMVSEVGEEFLGDGLRAVFDIEDFGAGPEAGPLERLNAAMNQDLENLPVMVAAFAVPGVGFAGAGAIGGAVIDRRKTKAQAAADKDAMAAVAALEPETVRENLQDFDEASLQGLVDRAEGQEGDEATQKASAVIKKELTRRAAATKVKEEVAAGVEKEKASQAETEALSDDDLLGKIEAEKDVTKREALEAELDRRTTPEEKVGEKAGEKARTVDELAAELEEVVAAPDGQPAKLTAATEFVKKVAREDLEQGKKLAQELRDNAKRLSERDTGLHPDSYGGFAIDMEFAIKAAEGIKRSGQETSPLAETARLLKPTLKKQDTVKFVAKVQTLAEDVDSRIAEGKLEPSSRAKAIGEALQAAGIDVNIDPSTVLAPGRSDYDAATDTVAIKIALDMATVDTVIEEVAEGNLKRMVQSGETSFSELARLRHEIVEATKVKGVSPYANNQSNLEWWSDLAIVNALSEKGADSRGKVLRNLVKKQARSSKLGRFVEEIRRVAIEVFRKARDFRRQLRAGQIPNRAKEIADLALNAMPAKVQKGVGNKHTAIGNLPSYRMIKKKWNFDQTDVVAGTVNNRVSKELEIHEKLFGPVDDIARQFPGKFVKGKRGLTRAAEPVDLLTDIYNKVKAGAYKDLIDRSIPIKKLIKERGLTGERAKGFREEVEVLRKGSLYLELDKKGAPLLGKNGKAGMSADFLLATCHPTPECVECYAASSMIRFDIVRKAYRNTVHILSNPVNWAERTAAESNKVPLIEMPFLRLLGSGDFTTTEQLKGFNHLAKLSNRPIQIFSRHHDMLAKLKGTEKAPFYMMGSIDDQLFDFYGEKKLKENMAKHKIANAYMLRSKKGLGNVAKLRKANALSLILPTSVGMHNALPEDAQGSSCPCDADERSYMTSCRQCAVGQVGCFMAFAEMGVDSKGRLWALNDSDAPALRPATQWFEASMLPQAYSKIAVDLMQKSIELVGLNTREFQKKQKTLRGKIKKEKDASEKKKLQEKLDNLTIKLKDIRFPGDIIEVKTVKASNIYRDNLKEIKAQAGRGKKGIEGSAFLPGGEIQPPIAIVKGEIIRSTDKDASGKKNVGEAKLRELQGKALAGDTTFRLTKLSDTKTKEIREKAEAAADPIPQKTKDHVGKVVETDFNNVVSPRQDILEFHMREMLGKTGPMNKERQSFEEWLAQARTDGIDKIALSIATEVINNPRSLSPAESAGMVIKLAEIFEAHEKAIKGFENLTDPTEIASRAAIIEALEKDHNILSEAMDFSGSERGRALVSQKLAINKSFELIHVLRRATVANAHNGKTLSKKDDTMLRKVTAALTKAQAKLEEVEVKNREQRAKSYLKAKITAKTLSGMSSAQKTDNMLDLVGRLAKLAKEGCDI